MSFCIRAKPYWAKPPAISKKNDIVFKIILRHIPENTDTFALSQIISSGYGALYIQTR